MIFVIVHINGGDIVPHVFLNTRTHYMFMFRIQFFTGFWIIPDFQNPGGIPDYRNSCCIPNDDDDWHRVNSLISASFEHKMSDIIAKSRYYLYMDYG